MVCSSPNPLEPVVTQDDDPLAAAFKLASSPPAALPKRQQAVSAVPRQVPPLQFNKKVSSEPVESHPLDCEDDGLGVTAADMNKEWVEAASGSEEQKEGVITIEAEGSSNLHVADDVCEEDMAAVQQLVSKVEPESAEDDLTPIESRRKRLIDALAGSEGPDAELEDAITHVSKLEVVE